MNNTFKKFLAILLSVLACLSCGVTAFAQEETPDEIFETGIICDYFFKVDAVVVTFDSKYIEIGKIPKILIDTQERNEETIERVEVSEDKIFMNIYEYDGKRFPQIFIKTDFCYRVMGLEIEEGAFVTETGEQSAKAVFIKESIDYSNNDSFCIVGEYEGYNVIDKPWNITDVESHWYGTVGKPINVKPEIKGEYAEAWKENIEFTYSVEGETAEISSDGFVPEKAGDYVLRIKLNDYFILEEELEVSSTAGAYFNNLGMYGKILLLAPVEFFFGIFAFIFAPGFGTIAGPGFMLDAFRQIPRFFIALIEGPEYETKEWE